MNHRPSLGVCGLVLAALIAPSAARGDEAADRLVGRVREATKSARSLRAEFTYTEVDGEARTSYAGRVRLMRPNYAFMESMGEKYALIVASDGASLYVVNEDGKTYRRRGAQPGRVRLWSETSPATAFFDVDAALAGGERRHAGREVVQGRAYDVLEVKHPDPPQTRRFFVGGSGMIERTVELYDFPKGRFTKETHLKEVDTTAAMAASDFAYAPPDGYAAQEVRKEDERELLAVGEAAPGFRLPRSGGGLVELAGSLKRRKAVLLNFWFYDCAPCRAEFPALERIGREHGDRGLEVIAVNAGDPAARVAKYLADNKLTLTVALGGEGDAYTLGEAYGVTAYPSSFLIGGGGKILWRGVGFDEAALLRALEAAGFR